MKTVQELYDIYKEYPRVSTDSRSLPKACIFFALRGLNFNGNLYAQEALDKGASYAVVDDPSLVGDRFLYVEDVLKALQELASYHRQQLKTPLIAITGTNGKTTTKELTAEVLKRSYKLLYTEGNLNNHIGVPLTLLRLTEEHQLALIEMGASKQGDIAELCSIAEPNYGLITNVGLAHLEGFSSFEGVKSAKAELYDYLREHEGIVFVREEDEQLLPLCKGIPALSYGTSPEASIQGRLVTAPSEHQTSDIKLQVEQLMLRFAWSVPSLGIETCEVQTKLVGGYNLMNCLAAISFGVYFDVPRDQISEALASYQPSNSRSQLLLSQKNNQIIVDAYNANPTSMRIALENFLTQKPEGYRVFILGAMNELGEASLSAHQELYSFLLQEAKASDVLCFCGSAWENCQLSEQEPDGTIEAPESYRFADLEAVKLFLQEANYSKRSILIKGSNSYHLDQVLDLL